MNQCSRCFHRATALRPLLSRKVKGFSHRVPRAYASSVASQLFFSPNLDSSRTEAVGSRSQRWDEDSATSSTSRLEKATLSKDVPFIPSSRYLPVVYPPLPLAAYKPVPALTPRRLLKVYSQLSKARLTSLMVLTAMAGVALCPLPTTIPVLLSTALGTALCSTSANTINQILEVPFDAQMVRTRNRPLVRRAISHAHAATFALVTGVAGPAILLIYSNPVTAILGTANIVLYSGVYTMMKRRSIWNTWVGAIVGGIPPLMGWTACGGLLLPSAYNPITFSFPPWLFSHSLPSSIDPSLALPAIPIVTTALAPLALFALLFSWQFPHFNGLSHTIRASYAAAGYRMLSVTSPRKNALVSLRHALLLVPICSVLIPASGLTTWAFAVTSAFPNAVAVRAAWVFWKQGTDAAARRVFFISLWWLPLILGLMMFHKPGLKWLEWVGWENSSEETNVGDVKI